MKAGLGEVANDLLNDGLEWDSAGVFALALEGYVDRRERAASAEEARRYLAGEGAK